MSSGLRALATALLARGVSMTGAFAFSVTCLRVLPWAEAGLVLLVYTLVTAAATVSRFGADTFAMREVARDPVAAGPVVGRAGWIPVILGVPAAFVLAGAVALQARGTAPAAVPVLAAVAVVPAASSVVAGATLRGLGRVGSGTLAELGSAVWIASAVLAGLARIGRADASGAGLALMVGYAVTALWAWLLVLRLVPGARTGTPAGGLAFLRRHRASLAGFFGAAIGSFLFAWLPVLVLGYADAPVRAQEDVALYNAGARPAQFVSLLALIQASYLGPRFARLFHDGDTDGITRVARRAVLISGAWAALTTAIVLVSPHAVLWVFGERAMNADAAAVLRVLAVGAFLVVLIGPATQVMLVVGREATAGRYTLALLLVGTIVLLLLARSGPVAVAAGAAAIALLYAAACWVRLAADGVQAGPVPLPIRPRGEAGRHRAPRSAWPGRRPGGRGRRL